VIDNQNNLVRGGVFLIADAFITTNIIAFCIKQPYQKKDAFLRIIEFALESFVDVLLKIILDFVRKIKKLFER